LGHQIILPALPYWQCFDLKTRNFENLRVRKPVTGHFSLELPTVARSAHYGIVAWEVNGGLFMKGEIEAPPARQASEQPVPTHREEEGQTDAKPGHAQNTPRADLAVILTDQQVEQIRKQIRELWDRGHTLPLDTAVYYSRGIATFDGWLPAVGAWSMYLDPPIKKEGYAFSIHRGRVARVDSLDHEGSNVKVWFNELEAPLLAVNETIQPKTGRYVPTRYRWGIYDDRGMLGKIIHFDRNLAISSIHVFEHADQYQYVIKTKYSRRGKRGKRELVKYPLDSKGRQILPGENRPVAYSPRLEEIKTPTRIGLKPYYPLPHASR
jgi:hypothetical protein